MPNAPLYPEAKPVDADVLILCEGDAVGYETNLLKTWADAADLNGRFVKVMACGTGEALYGIADAIGRTVPIIVVEDRDFRTVDEARAECEKKLRNREGRNVAMRAWFAWQRAEIENYFTDDFVLSVVLADAFGCSQDDVRSAAQSALDLLAVSQALEYALYRARKSWASTDANRALRVEALVWDVDGPRTLTASDVREKLNRRLKKWQKSLHDGTTWEDPMAGEQLLADFDTKCRDWMGLKYEDTVWRVDWACKELVKHVRMKLAAQKAGWWSIKLMPNRPVDWSAMKDDKARDAYDRGLERVLQPKLVQALAARLRTNDSFDLREELESLKNAIRAI